LIFDASGWRCAAATITVAGDEARGTTLAAELCFTAAHGTAAHAPHATLHDDALVKATACVADHNFVVVQSISVPFFVAHPCGKKSKRSRGCNGSN